MNKFVLCTSVSIALFLAACGDDSSSVEPSLEESSSSIVKSSSSTTTKKSSNSSSVKSSSSAKSSSSVKTSSSSKKIERSSSSAIQSSSSVMPGMVDPSTVVLDSITDSRDGQVYKTVTIGTQTWMAENLNYKTANSYCYGNEDNCATYGRLYKWDAGKIACPSGWHLPTTGEFETLFTAVGGEYTAGEMLKSTSGWNGYNGKKGNGTDDYSFSALSVGHIRDNGLSSGEGYNAGFWSSTENFGGYGAFTMWLDNSYGRVSLNHFDKDYGFSVRCVKD